MKTAACMTMGSMTWTACTQAQRDVLARCDMPVFWCAGGFWEQGLTNLWQEKIAEGYDWVLVTDHDSCFTPEDVDALCKLAEEDDADAICGTQIKRGGNRVLMVPRGFECEGKTAPAPQDDSPLTRISVGHFGLTLLRTAAIATLPTPWFRSSTGPEGRIDPDIYFWRAWDRTGHTLYQANDVLVGHLQFVVTWPTRNRKVAHQFLADWLRDGKPPGVVVDSTGVSS